jgi:hypothetical protein
MRSPARAAATLLTFFVVASGCHPPLPGTYLLKAEDGDPYLERSGAKGARLRPEICRNVPEDRTDERHLDENFLISFLERQGYRTTMERARPDLVYVDVQTTDEPPLRLRVAILPDTHAAGQNLHRALLEQGKDAWGVHRSNLAVLAPGGGTLRHAITFAGRTRLACWGVLTIAAEGDDFVVPGGYSEF